MSNWSRVRQLSPAERWLLVQALALLPLTALALWLVGFRRWQALLTRLAPVGGAPAAGDAATLLRQSRATARLVDAAARRGPYRASCLPRSLTLWWLLRRQGIATELRIGVRKAAGALEAHAWVEYQGLILNDRDDVCQRFAAFARPLVPAGASPL
jgi:hypothetical protein